MKKAALFSGIFTVCLGLTFGMFYKLSTVTDAANSSPELVGHKVLASHYTDPNGHVVNVYNCEGTAGGIEFSVQCQESTSPYGSAHCNEDITKPCTWGGDPVTPGTVVLIDGVRKTCQTSYSGELAAPRCGTNVETYGEGFSIEYYVNCSDVGKSCSIDAVGQSCMAPH